MRKNFPSALLVALFAVAAVPAFPAPEGAAPTLAERVYEKSRRAAVLLHVLPGEGQGIYYGTGAFISADGLVITSTTVVPPKAKVTRVMLHDGRTLDADVVCLDEPSELALVRVRGKGPFEFLSWGNSDLVRVGDPCFTVGDIFSSMGSSAQVAISEGIVSGRYRLMERAAVVQQPVFQGEVIETSASMNPGTDGGPLVDAGGRLVGLVSLNLSPARFEGVAVPVNALRKKVEDLMKTLPEAEQKAIRNVLDASTTYVRDPASDTPIARAASDRSVNLVRIRVKRKGEAPAAAPPKPVPPPAEPGQPPPLQQREMETVPGFQDMISKRPDVPLTAVVWDAEGRLLTSYYNLANAETVEFETPDGRWEPCEMLGWHKDYDLAFLNATPGRSGFPRSRAEELRAGEEVGVLALSPYDGGARHTLETGIVSATKRIFNSAVQFDARVAFADSGAALVDAKGSLAGIVTHFDPSAPAGLISGVSFSTPLSRILEVEKDLIAGKRIDAAPRPMLGFGPDPESTGPGLKVGRVIPGTGAEKGGLAVGDVIVEFDRIRIMNFPHLFDVIQGKKVGDTVKLLVRRGEKEMEMSFVLGLRPPEGAIR